MFGKTVALISIIVLCSCNSESNRQNDANLLEEAQRLPLQSRYELYKKVFNRQRPPDLLLASSVAELGRPALKYAISKAQHGDRTDILSAIEIVRLLARGKNLECADAQLLSVNKNIIKQFDSRDVANIVQRRFRFACGS